MPTIALAQFAPTGDASRDLERGLQLMAEAADAGAALVAFPEISFRPFFPRHRAQLRYFEWAEPIPGPTTDRVREAAARLGIVTIVNLFERAGRGRYYDASPVIDADGALLGVSRMAHVAEEPHFNEKFYYWPGDSGFRVYDTAAGRVGVAICYDRHFPELMRSLVMQGAELIVSPFVGLTTDPLDLYRVEMQATSFQNQVYIACVNRADRGGGPGAAPGEGGGSAAEAGAARGEGGGSAAETGAARGEGGGPAAEVDAAPGEEPTRFAGSSFVTAPSGKVAAEAPPLTEDLLLVECDWDEIDRWRQRRPFLRDRRPELYGGDGGAGGAGAP